MQIKRLSVDGIRNLAAGKHFFQETNFFWGSNGSGKTSLLESIYLLFSGRSFRSSKVDTLINFDCSELTIAGEVLCGRGEELKVGYRRSRAGEACYKIAGKKATRTAVAKLGAIHLIDAKSHYLVTGEAKFRRDFIDWALFHVEPSFLPAWRMLQKSVLQRNAVLKEAKSLKGLAIRLRPWDNMLIEASVTVSRLRQRYLDYLLPELNRDLANWFEIKLDAEYLQGWPQGMSLEQSLTEVQGKDFCRKTTSVGPQRADIQLKIKQLGAKVVLSRGQQKLLACALILIRAELIQQTLRESGVFLLDDIAAELDVDSQDKFFSKLQRLGGQLFITSIENSNRGSGGLNEAQVFHVEQGHIKMCAGDVVT